MSNYCKNCYELTEELENHKRWLNDYKRKLKDAEEFANAKIKQCENLIKQLNETHEQLDQLKETNEDLLSIQYKLADNNKQLRQTLEEIKVFVMQAKHDYNLPKCLFDTILQKISEVENEEI